MMDALATLGAHLGAIPISQPLMFALVTAFWVGRMIHQGLGDVKTFGSWSRFGFERRMTLILITMGINVLWIYVWPTFTLADVLWYIGVLLTLDGIYQLMYAIQAVHRTNNKRSF